MITQQPVRTRHCHPCRGGAVSSGSGVLIFGCCCFCCFWAWLCCVRGWLRWCRAWWRAGPCDLPVMLPGGAVEARRSRVPRSGIASATPKAPLTWEGQPRRLRGTTVATLWVPNRSSTAVTCGDHHRHRLGHRARRRSGHQSHHRLDSRTAFRDLVLLTARWRPRFYALG
jgi:hypothetical protein